MQATWRASTYIHTHAHTYIYIYIWHKHTYLIYLLYVYIRAYAFFYVNKRYYTWCNSRKSICMSTHISYLQYTWSTCHVHSNNSQALDRLLKSSRQPYQPISLLSTQENHNLFTNYANTKVTNLIFLLRTWRHFMREMIMTIVYKRTTTTVVISLL